MVVQAQSVEEIEGPRVRSTSEFRVAPAEKPAAKGKKLGGGWRIRQARAMVSSRQSRCQLFPEELLRGVCKVGIRQKRIAAPGRFVCCFSRTITEDQEVSDSTPD